MSQIAARGSNKLASATHAQASELAANGASSTRHRLTQSGHCAHGREAIWKSSHVLGTE